MGKIIGYLFICVLACFWTITKREKKHRTNQTTANTPPEMKNTTNNTTTSLLQII